MLASSVMAGDTVSDPLAALGRLVAAELETIDALGQRVNAGPGITHHGAFQSIQATVEWAALESARDRAARGLAVLIRNTPDTQQEQAVSLIQTLATSLGIAAGTGPASALADDGYAPPTPPPATTLPPPA